MTCELTECKFYDTSKCALCHNEFYYEGPKKRYSLKKNTQKADGRKGSNFEYANHKRNEEVLKSSLTLNSGATKKQKGDENITGIIRIMEELKTYDPMRAKGNKSFAIKREWLDKLAREAQSPDYNFEFWWLVFSYSELEGSAIDQSRTAEHPAGNVFVCVEKDVMMDMAGQLANKRLKEIKFDERLELANKKAARYEAENIALKARIEELEAKIKTLQVSDEEKELFEAIQKIA